MTRRRRILAAAGVFTVVGLIAGISAVTVLRSEWFFEKVRAKLVSTVETATGGRVEAGAFRFDWRSLRAEIRGFTLHGNEPAGKPPLFHAASVAVGLKVVSVWKRDFDVQSVDVVEPHVYLIVYPDGSTNLPKPKISKKRDRTALETILDLKIATFNVERGIFEMDNRKKTPFELHGRNLKAALQYDATGPRYRGNLAMQPVDVNMPELQGGKAIPVGVELAVEIEGRRIGVRSGTLTTGDSRLEISGGLEDLVTPRLAFRYKGRVAVPDLARVLRLPELERGSVDLNGDAGWSEAAGFTGGGDLHAYRVDYRDRSLILREGKADGTYRIGREGVDVERIRASAAYVRGANRVPVAGNIAALQVRGRDLNVTGAALSLLGGSFRGKADLRNLERLRVEGEIAGFEIRRAISIYSPYALPWDGRASGPVRLETSIRRRDTLRLTTTLTIDPAVEGPPVHGQVTANYDAEKGVLDVGRSSLALPSSRVDFSGVLPPGPGRQMQVHLETRNLDDLLPALGQSAANTPVKLTGGSVVFDGTVTGDMDNPHVEGRLNAARFTYSGEAVDSLQGAVRASPVTVELHDGIVQRGGLRARVEAVVGLDGWKAGDQSPIAGSATIREASVKELLALAKAGDVEAEGTLNGSIQATGTVGKPALHGEVELVKGSLAGEPFDAFHAKWTYSGRQLNLASAEALAGPGRVQLSGTYDHADGNLKSGRARFQLNTNDVPLERLETLRRARPGARGTVQATVRGDVELRPAASGPPDFRISDLHAEVFARDLQVTGQALGNAHLTADSDGPILRTHLESDFANSTFRGEGSWRLEGDYPGSAVITFARLDFGQLRQWISPADPGAPMRFAGFAEGELRIEGPARRPSAMKAQLRLPKLQVRPSAESGAAMGALLVENAGDIVATLANSVVTVTQARLQGKSTDLNVTGRVVLQPRTSLDLRADGTVDLALAHEFVPDLTASGTLTTDATIRGTLESPQILGRMQFKDVSLNVADMPNGISEASGAVQFTGDRATIQSFTGSTGGGKIQLSGFVGYGGKEIIFRLHADADTVRVRIPQGASITTNAALDFTGTAERSMLSGNISILRTGFNLQSDFSSVIAKSAEPVQTPAARTGLLGGLNFDVQISTAPDAQLLSSLTQDLQAEANLQLRGTVSNPALIGRVTITQGQVLFYGTKYTINQGSISFYNPVKIEPFLDIDLETKAKGIDVTLTVSGPLNKPTLTPRSDPPLQFSEIVALLATGRTPTSDPTLLARQSTTPQSWQQNGASALLGQAIASPVAGRLQRFFGVSKLRIDPTLRGVENNPQARVTVEQQVTADITFTYITNVTNSNPQVVRIEWSVSKQWAVVALRDENGTFGMDFYFKRQF